MNHKNIVFLFLLLASNMCRLIGMQQRGNVMYRSFAPLKRLFTPKRFYSSRYALVPVKKSIFKKGIYGTAGLAGLGALARYYRKHDTKTALPDLLENQERLQWEQDLQKQENLEKILGEQERLQYDLVEQKEVDRLIQQQERLQWEDELQKTEQLEKEYLVYLKKVLEKASNYFDRQRISEAYDLVEGYITDLRIDPYKVLNILAESESWLAHPRFVPIVALLLQKGVDPNIPIDKHGNRMIHKMLYSQEMLKELFRHNATPNVPNSRGEYPIHTIVSDDWMNVENLSDYLDLLLNANANVNIRSKDGVTPLTKILRSSKYDYNEKEFIIRKLLSRGAIVGVDDIVYAAGRAKPLSRMLEAVYNKQHNK